VLSKQRAKAQPEFFCLFIQIANTKGAEQKAGRKSTSVQIVGLATN
jgi:hypothetical protein